MKKHRLLLTAVILLTCTAQAQVHIPELRNIRIDGQDSDWDNAYEFDIISSEFGESPANSSATIKLGYEKDSLLLYAEINDATPITNIKHPWDGDSLELFIADGRGKNNLIQFAIAANEENETGIAVIDFRKGDLNDSAIDYECRKLVTADGYTIEFRIPMTNLSADHSFITPSLQILWNDRFIDGNKGKSRYLWKYSADNLTTTYSQQQLRFAAEPSPRQPDIKAWLIDDQRLYIQIDSNEEVTFETLDHVEIIPEKYTPTLNTYEFGEEIAANRLPMLIKTSTVTTELDLNLVPMKYEEKLQPNYFEKDIRVFEAHDRHHMPSPGGLIAVGSSSIRKWHTIHEDLKYPNIINRGFGGAKSTDVLFYMDRIVLPYQPSKIIYYAGENDVNIGRPLESTIGATKEFIEATHEKLPETKIYLLSLKVAIRRLQNLDKILAINNGFRELAAQYDFVEYVDTFSKSLDSNGNIRSDIFMSDGSHTNRAGYNIWSEVLNESLTNSTLQPE